MRVLPVAGGFGTKRQEHHQDFVGIVFGACSQKHSNTVTDKFCMASFLWMGL